MIMLIEKRPDGQRMCHILKTHMDPFAAVWNERKTAEFRRNDRDFQVGDFLILREYDHEKDEYPGREIEARVTHVARGPSFGIPEGFAMISMKLKGKSKG